MKVKSQIIKVENKTNDQCNARSQAPEKPNEEIPKNMEGFQRTYLDNYKNPSSTMTRAERRHQNMLKAQELREKGLAVPRFPHNHNRLKNQGQNDARTVITKSRTGNKGNGRIKPYSGANERVVCKNRRTQMNK